MRQAIIATLAALGFLGACSDDSEPERARVQPPPQRCELAAPDRQVFVRLTGERARELCVAWLRPGPGGEWTKPSGPADPGQRFRRVCVLYRGGSAAGLYATGSISSVAQAKTFCSGLLDRGWSELGRLDPELAQDNAAPSPELPVRCAEGRCFQRGRRVSRPRSGAECDGGRWTSSLSRDQNFGVFRCR